MSTAEFQTYLTGGLALLAVAVLSAAWLLWREREHRLLSYQEALVGVGQELKITLQRVLVDLARLAAGEDAGRGAFLPMGRPQLEAVNLALVPTNRRAVAVMGAFYEEFDARKAELRAAILENRDYEDYAQLTLDSCIEGIATLFLWETYGGASPQEAPSTRSWDVRAWMKQHGFGQFVFPDLHLRDAVVERLRNYGMTLTPKPLTHTAHEYWSLRYDRDADPNTAIGFRLRRKPKRLSEFSAAGAAAAAPEPEPEETAAPTVARYDADEPDDSPAENGADAFEDDARDRPREAKADDLDEAEAFDDDQGGYDEDALDEDEDERALERVD